MSAVFAIGLCAISSAQTIVSYRYWYDGNIGAATSVNVTGVLDLNLTTALATNSLSNGYHYITMQFKDANGIYSSPQTWRFVRTGFNISGYEYWWDANYANHTSVSVTPTQTIDLSAALIPYNLDTGLHLFAIRFKDEQGNWSVPIQDSVYTTKLISGIAELASVNNISLYPNPTHSATLLKFDGMGNEILTMTMTDVLGKTVQQQQLQNSVAQQQYELNTDELAAGIYFVKLSSARGSATRQLVVQ
ncbi:MAG: hypothetical protein JWO06_3763 [Bacteroidota bacterium]|nr:hypothetical protein [Bacteroidota bacterium]